MSNETAATVIVINSIIVTTFAYLTALSGWSMLWWVLAFSMLVLPKEDKK